jgi:hypothetical protein
LSGAVALAFFASWTWPPIASRAGLVDGEPGIEIYPEIGPQGNDIVIKKHRYSGFYGTDLEIVLRGLGVDTVIVTGVTTENCCHATARDAMFRDYKVVFGCRSCCPLNLSPCAANAALTSERRAKGITSVCRKRAKSSPRKPTFAIGPACWASTPSVAARRPRARVSRRTPTIHAAILRHAPEALKG